MKSTAFLLAAISASFAFAAPAEKVGNATVPVPAISNAWFRAFSGPGDCAGASGEQIEVERSAKCIYNPQRHSFQLGPGCNQYSVTVCSGKGCSANTNSYTYGPGCHGVNTGGGWYSTNIYCINPA